MNVFERMSRANELLSPHATPHEGKLGRLYPQPMDDRFPFARDRDRIIETNAFRRMDGKTQVYVDGVSDHFRNRLTHTLEIAGESRNVANSLGLNEHLVEALALAHDIGHPPIGHQGEEILNELLLARAIKGGFNHNLQGYRIVTWLERPYLDIPGLNLNQEVTNGMLKNGLIHPVTQKPVEHGPEAHVVDNCDRAGYVAHDTQDGLKGELFHVDQLADVPLCRDIIREVGREARTIRAGILRVLLSDLKQTSYASMQGPKPVIGMSPAMAAQRDELYAFLKEHMYSHPKVHVRRQEGQAVIKKLFHSYINDPPQAVLDRERMYSCSRERATADYIAGMSDGFLMQEGAKIA